MFTGLIESVGEIAALKRGPDGMRLQLRSELASELAPGDSLAVNGVCLTVIATSAAELHVDVSPETVRASTLGSLKPGTPVNLERPLRADGRVGGHFVQGHVDATGTLEEARQEGGFYRVTIKFPALLAPYIVRKGSIAVDGISLTVAGISDQRFDVQIVPFTWDHTNLKSLQAHDAVNLECDILGKYVVRVAELSDVGPMKRSRTTH